ncbi:MAG: hypothetical protein AAB548_00885 [Patescibacteria group bacterium]
MLKRLLLGLFSLLILFSISLTIISPAFAAEKDPTADMLEDFCNRRTGNQMNLEIWYSGKCKAPAGDPSSIGFSQIVLLDLLSRMQGDSLKDLTPQEVIQKLLTLKDGKPIAQIPNESISSNGILSQLGNILGKTYASPPVSFGQYLASVRDNISRHGIVQPAYAQGTGFGFQNLLPILPIWRAFRNVAYFVFILVFVLYGFMIMFRMKINPQNVATFQSAIPKIVTTLILITFAYAIAGFMIDLMFVLFNLILSVFQASGIITNPEHPAVKIGSGQAGILGSFAFSQFISFLFVPPRLISILSNTPTAVGFVTDLILTVSGLGILLRIIIIFAIIYTYLKLIFKLFEAYITVIIQVIFSPLILLQDVLPGSDAFGGWLRNIVANLSVFPVSMVMLLLSYIFMVQPLASIGFLGIGNTVTGVQNLQEAGTLGLNLPLISVGVGTDSSAVLVVIGFFILLMASKYVDMVKDALKVPPFKYGTAIGEALQYGYGRADIMTRRPDDWLNKLGTRWKPRDIIAGAKKAGVKPKPPELV